MNTAQPTMNRTSVKLLTILGALATFAVPVGLFAVSASLVGIGIVVPDPDGAMIGLLSFPFFILSGMSVYLLAYRSGVIR